MPRYFVNQKTRASVYETLRLQFEKLFVLLLCCARYFPASYPVILGGKSNVRSPVELNGKIRLGPIVLGPKPHAVTR